MSGVDILTQMINRPAFGDVVDTDVYTLKSFGVELLCESSFSCQQKHRAGGIVYKQTQSRQMLARTAAFSKT